MAKKVVQDTEAVNEAETLGREGGKDVSPAMATLHPGTMPVGPANKSFAIGKIVNAFAGMSPEAINKFWEMIDGVGHEADGAPDASQSNKDSLNMKPSGASTANIGANDAYVREDETFDANKIIAEDLGSLFEGSDLSDETKEKFAVLFESAVNLKVAQARLALDERYEVELDEELEGIAQNLAESMDTYLDHAVGKWLEENAVQIESTLTRDMTESFLEDMRSVFEKHYVEIPEGKVDVVEELAARITELEELANDALEANEVLEAEKEELFQAIDGMKASEALAGVSEGLTDTEVEKLESLVEGIEFKDVEEFTKKATIIRDSHFKKVEGASTINKAGVLFEEVDKIDENDEPTKVAGPMASYVDAISHITRK